jgi:hypothetical protein
MYTILLNEDNQNNEKDILYQGNSKLDLKIIIFLIILVFIHITFQILL